MTEIISGVRAKAGFIRTRRFDKAGKVVESLDHGVPSMGMFSAKEMEAVMREVPKEVGASEDSVVIETYEKDDAPMDYNPRRTIPAKMWFRGERRQVWGGWTPERKDS